MGDPSEAMRARLREDLRAAMKARDAVTTSVLRGLIATIDNAQAVAAPAASPTPVGGSQWVAGSSAFGTGEVARRTLDAGEVDALLQGEAAKRLSLAAEMDGYGRAEDAARARAEAAIAQRYVGDADNGSD